MKAALAIGLLAYELSAFAADDLGWQAPFEPRLPATDAAQAGVDSARCRAIQLDASNAGAAITVALVRRAPSLDRIVGAERDECDSADPYREGSRPMAADRGGVVLADAALPENSQCFAIA